MSKMDEYLKKYGLKYEELNSAERTTLKNWQESLNTNPMTIRSVYGYIKNLRVAVEQELDTFRKETPPNFLSLLALLLPFYGIVKKWYQDEHKVYLEARLHNLLLIESFMIGPARAKQAMDRAVKNMADKIKK